MIACRATGLVPGARTASRRRDREAGLRLERNLYVVANWPIPDLGVDRGRSRIREIRIQAAEAAPGLQQPVAQRRDGGCRIAAAPMLRRRVDGIDGPTGTGLARACGHRARASAVDPEE